MKVIVTLDLYSGRPNPTWELTETQATELLQRFQSPRSASSFSTPAQVGRLGYRGFSVQTLGETDMPQALRVFDGVLASEILLAQNYIDSDSEIEQFLLGTAGNAIIPQQQGFVAAEIAKNSHGGVANSFLSQQALMVPPFNPAKWNNDIVVLRNNNCYNYANDKITNSFAQPGRASGAEGPFPPDCAGTGAAAVRDGQIATTSVASTPQDGHYIALVIWPGNDYHWYRLDSNNQWSHKPGGTPARNTDDSGNLIVDPKICDRGPYTIFCGYYHSIPSKTRII
jgi:hypothetical protein